MGRLVWAENAAISIKLNGKTFKLEIEPETELWRHGTELQSASQLILGEDVRAIYTDVAADGSPKPALVVESEAHDTVKMALTASPNIGSVQKFFSKQQRTQSPFELETIGSVS